MLETRNLLLVGGLALATATILVGCSSESATPPPQAETVSGDDWTTGLDADVVTALSELAESDRTAAVAQKVCPVTDKQLGSMGKPYKVTVEGQDVFLCCDGCKTEIKSNAEKYLAKLSSN
jgi:hypothetical protein